MSPCLHNWPRGWPYPGFELEHELPLNLVSSDPNAGAERLFSNCFLSVFPPFYLPISRCFSRRLNCFFLMLFPFLWSFSPLSFGLGPVWGEKTCPKNQAENYLSYQQPTTRLNEQLQRLTIVQKKNTARSKKERDWSGFMQSTNSL